MTLRVHRIPKLVVALLALGALGVATGCNKDNPAGPKNQGVGGVSDAPGNYFVDAANGDDGNTGARSAPFKSIQKAIDVAAVGNTKADIFVAYGTYASSITLKKGMSLHGGYSPATWVRSLTADSTVIDGGPTAISGSDADSVTIDGFTIRSADATAAGGSSVGIHLKDGSVGVRIADNRIFVGKGKAGANGAVGAGGLDVTGSGSKGADGGGCPNDGGSGQASTIGSKGGNGGDGTLGDGGNGGGGSGPGAGGGGSGGNIVGSPSWGLDGGVGGPGSDGGDGAKGGSFGTFSSGNYVPAAGSKGVDGGHGGGGGGGGAGTGTLLICGPGGGGGGAGGGGAKGGGAGGGGGGSFGVLLMQGSTGSLENNVIVANSGGNGGSGVRGGFGGSGGGGGTRGAQASDFLGDKTSTAGFGGDGGDGGDGGYGGGGGGGPSIGIVEDAASTFSRVANQIAVGTAGTGGFSSGNRGDNGVTDLYRKL